MFRSILAVSSVLLLLTAPLSHALATEARPGMHRMPLPDPKRVSVGRDWANVDAVAGDAPSPEHPRGTVVVAQAIAQEPSPSVTEWDVASGSLVRSAPLPWPAAFADVRLVRAGDSFHVVGAEPRGGQIAYARLSRALGVERIEPLGRGERPRIATDGSIVAVLWSGTWVRAPGEARGWQLVTLDARGDPLAHVCLVRTSVSTAVYGEPMTVAGGRVFVLLPDGPAPRFVQLGADARVERSRSLSFGPLDGRFFVSSERVFFTDNCTYVELWPVDGGDVERGSLPRRREGARSCTPFGAAADASGRLVTTEGDVLSADFEVERHFADPLGVVTRALWIEGQPALVVVGAAGGRASFVWGDADEAPP